MTSLANLGNLLAYFVTSVALLIVFILIYTKVTPYDEWSEIRAGNRAAAVHLSGAILGFSLPLASSIIHSVSLTDMAAWAAVSLMLQLACFGAMRLIYRNVSDGIAHGDLAEATLLATISIVLGLLNAACLS